MSTDADKAVQIAQVEMEYRVDLYNKCAPSSAITRNEHRSQMLCVHFWFSIEDACHCMLHSWSAVHGEAPQGTRRATTD